MQITFTQPFTFVCLGDSRHFAVGDTMSEPTGQLLAEAEGKYEVEVKTAPVVSRTAPEVIPYSARPMPEPSRGKGK